MNEYEVHYRRKTKVVDGITHLEDCVSDISASCFADVENQVISPGVEIIDIKLTKRGVVPFDLSSGMSHRLCCATLLTPLLLLAYHT